MKVVVEALCALRLFREGEGVVIEECDIIKEGEKKVRSGGGSLWRKA